MRTNQPLGHFGLLVFSAALTVAPVYGQNKTATTASTTAATTAQAANTANVAAGQKMKLSGVIVRRDADTVIVRDQNGSDYTVLLNNFTKIEERKSNIFRGAKKYNVTALLRGLVVEVEGKGNGTALVADKVRAKDVDLMMARTVETRVTPVEGRVDVTENRLTESEKNAQRLSGQIEELSAITNTVRGEAKAAMGEARVAQNTADAAIAGVEATNKRMETWMSSLDDYEAKRGIAVNFRVGRADLSPEAKMALDEIAAQAKTERGYIIEVMGFASADGSENKNRALSQKRADAVVRYLAENHMVPLRRIITPFGYGEAQPVGDNLTREGREQNRRVEVKLLVNKAMTEKPAPVQMQRPAAGANTSLNTERPREATRTTSVQQ